MMNCVKISLYGDLTFGENYQAKYDFYEKVSILRQKGYDFLFENIAHFLKKSDYNIANLETPITNIKKSELNGKKIILHWSDPLFASSLLKKYNVHAVSLGNNHGYDFYHEGLKQTFEELSSSGISYFGAGENANEAIKPLKKTFALKEDNLEIYVFGGYKYRKDYDKEFNFMRRKINLA